MRVSVSGLASVMLVAGMVAVSSPAQAQEAAGTQPAGVSVEPQVWDELAEGGSTTVWVYLAEQADLGAASTMSDRVAQGQFVYDTLTATADRSQADLLRMLDEAGVPYESFWIVNAVRVDGADAELVERIAARSDVSEITADKVYHIPEPIEGTAEARIEAVEWNIDRINAPDVWDQFGVTGEGIVVAAIDTGADFMHPAIVDQYRGNLGNGQFDHNYNWWDPSNICGSPSLVPCDNNGHGTHVTGTMVGDDGGDNQIGVAPGAEWMIAKGCESSTCSQSALLSAGQFIEAPTDLNGENADPSKRPHVVNNSWGGGADTDPWYQPTVQAWVAAGIFPQFANGNTTFGTAPCGSSSNPGNLVESYAAGAFDINGNIANFSNRGPSAWDPELIKPNISAPGVNVRSSVPGGGYTTLSGTSMASPHVAGVVALMWSAAISLQRDVDSTKALLNTTAVDTEDLTCGGTAENNNVWGEGQIDAFAAVDQSPRGPTGVLSGTVADSVTGDPIAGATVTITGEVDRERTTGADGTYQVTLPVGQYTVTASAFGYEDGSAQVDITEGQTTVQDFDLQPLDSGTISGTVTDGSGHGWPLYARIEVSGAPIPDVFTDPVSGSYSFDLPVGTTVTLTVNAVSDGYDAESRQVTAEPGGRVEDFALTVGQGCNAPGYDFVTTGGASAGALGTGSGGRTAAVLPEAESGSSPAAIGEGSLTTTFASNNGFAGNTFDLDPVVPLFVRGFDVNISPAGGEHTVTVYWKEGTADGFESDPEAWTELGSDVVAAAGLNEPTHVDVGGLQIMPGTTYGFYVDLESYPSGTLRYTNGGPQTFSNDVLELTTYVGKGDPAFAGTTFTSRMWNGTVHYDLGSFDCAPVPGGLLVGNVTEQNEGTAINGATVTSVGNPDESATTVATPEDENLGDGFYFLFSSSTGSQEFTASASKFQDDTRTVDVVADATTRADFSLGAGHLVVEPAAVEAEVRLGSSGERTFTVTNDGTGPAQVELGERIGDFEIAGGQPASEPVRRTDADPDATTSRGAFVGGAPAGMVPQAPGDVIDSWPSGLELNWGVGFDGDVWISDIPNVNTNTEFTTDGNPTGVEHDATWAGTWPGDMAYDETRGWMCQVNVGGDNGIYCWDPASGEVMDSMTGAPWSGISQRGLAYNPTDDTFYIGGWNEGIIYHVAGFSHPTPGETLSQCTAPDPAPSGFAYNPTAELLWMATNSATDTIYLVDPSDCSTVQTLAFPDSAGFSGAGIEMDSEGNLWLTNQSNGTVYLLESGVPHNTDVPWLSVDPQTFTVGAGETVTVTVSLDGDVEQPGTYTAAVSVGHDTPYEVDPVGVTMVVTPPNNWGKISGTVSGQDCQGGTMPLSGAIVHIDGKRDDVTLTTDADGRYAYWMPANNSPATLIVTASGHVPQARKVSFRPGQEVVEHFHLAALC